MYPGVCRGATFHFRRYIVLQCLPLSSSPFFRSVHCHFLPVKYRFYLTSFYWIKRLLNTPANYFSCFYWIKTLLFSMTAKHLMFQFQFSFMIIIFGANLYHRTWQNPGNFGTLFVILIVMYLYFVFYSCPHRSGDIWPGRDAGSPGLRLQPGTIQIFGETPSCRWPLVILQVLFTTATLKPKND